MTPLYESQISKISFNFDLNVFNVFSPNILDIMLENAGFVFNRKTYSLVEKSVVGNIQYSRLSKVGIPC